MEQLTLNLWQKLVAIANEVHALQKDTEINMGSGRSYRGISHDSVVKSCKDALAKFAVLAVPSVTEHTEEIYEDTKERTWHKSSYTIKTTFINADAPEEREEVFTRGIGLDTGDKSAGKAMSYAKKYGLTMPLQMFAGDGDETRATNEHPGRRANTGDQPRPATDKQLEYLAKLRKGSKVTKEMQTEIDRYLGAVEVSGKPTQKRASSMIDRLQTLSQEDSQEKDGGDSATGAELPFEQEATETEQQKRYDAK